MQFLSIRRNKGFCASNQAQNVSLASIGPLFREWLFSHYRILRLPYCEICDDLWKVPLFDTKSTNKGIFDFPLFDLIFFMPKNHHTFHSIEVEVFYNAWITILSIRVLSMLSWHSVPDLRHKSPYFLLCSKIARRYTKKCEKTSGNFTLKSRAVNIEMAAPIEIDPTKTVKNFKSAKPNSCPPVNFSSSLRDSRWIIELNVSDRTIATASLITFSKIDKF